MPVLLSLLVLAGLCAAAGLGRLPMLVPAFVSLASLVSLLLYAFDKRASRRGDRRVRERTLHLWSLVGGWPGALAGRTLLRHKTRKQPFRSLFLVTVVLNLALLAALAIPPGDALAWRADAAVREWLCSTHERALKLLDKTNGLP
jgi:uncharacterized membrane protein YsdA (DUF1294 family)